MRKYIYCIALTVSFLLVGCSQQQEEKKGFDIIGAWTLEEMRLPTGTCIKPNETGYTRLKIYDADSIYYTLELFAQGDELLIKPHETAKYTQYDSVYIENDRVTPFRIINDSVFTTVWNGYTEVWVRATGMRYEQIEEIKKNFSNFKENSETLNGFISGKSTLTKKEVTKTYLIALSVLIVIIICGVVYLVITLKGKRKVQKELEAILEENNNRPVEMAEIAQKAENDFFGSDYYTSLHKRVMRGENLKKADWEEMSAQLKEAFPKFESRLSSLCKMSEVEMQVCMLLKMRFSPSEIATVIIKDASTISSIRGRLYQKVFGRKGGAKDWDEFLKTL